MRRAREHEVSQAAARRLDLLRQELGLDAVSAQTRDAGAAPAPPPEDPGEVHEYGSVAGPGRTPVLPVGRHSRAGIGIAQRWGGWLEDRLPERFRGRIQIGPRELSLVAVLAALALAAGAIVVLRSGVSADAVPVAAPTAGPSLLTPAAGAIGTAIPTPPAARAARSTAPMVVVDVAGKVRRPGVIQLPSGARVIDALRKAGGPRTHVDLTALNLARVLTDGEQILVGRPDPASGGVAGAAASATPGSPGSLVNLNSATQEQLETLPGVGPVTAQKILDWRRAHARFSSLDELLEVSGIGDTTLARLAPYLTL